MRFYDKEYYKQWRIDNQEKSNARHKRYEESHAKERKEYYEKNTTEVFNRRLLRDYGITANEYQKILSEQSHGCDICGKTKEQNGKLLCVDHNHITNKVRGILCSHCNSALGLVNDDPLILIKLSEYIIKHNKNDEKLYKDSTPYKRRKQYQQLLTEQLSGCSVCNVYVTTQKTKFVVDHNHLTGKIRSVLCGHCNLTLGLFNDDPMLLLEAVNYILKNT